MIQTNGGRNLILVGGGHAHVQVLKAFADRPPHRCRLTVVVDEPVAMYSGMTPGFVAGQYSRADLEIDVRPLAAMCDAEMIAARCVRVDPVAQRIELAGRGALPYDVASFNIGSTVIGLDAPGAAEHTLPSRPLSRLVLGMAGLIARARTHQAESPFHVVVVGGGVGGVELAFTVQHRLGRETGRRIDLSLLNQGSRILARYPESLVRRVKKLAAARGIELRNDVRVAAVDAGGVALESGERIRCQAVLWVTGPASHPVFSNSEGIRTDGRGFVCIRSTLQFEDYDNLFAVGDCASMTDFPQLPKAGVYAVRQGPYITHNLRAYLSGEPLRAYRPQQGFLTLLNVGDGRAVGCKWGVTFGGKWVMKLKDGIDRRFMARYQLPWHASASGAPSP